MMLKIKGKCQNAVKKESPTEFLPLVDKVNPASALQHRGQPGTIPLVMDYYPDCSYAQK